MARTQIKIEGFAELRNRIAKLDGKLQKKVYRKAVQAGSKLVVTEAASKVPVRTGTIRKSVVARASSKPAKGLFGVKVTIKGGARASNRTAKRRGRGAMYYPDAVERYYRFQELGTKHHPAKAFLKPALTGKASAVLEAIKTELAAGLDQACRSL